MRETFFVSKKCENGFRLQEMELFWATLIFMKLEDERFYSMLRLDFVVNMGCFQSLQMKVCLWSAVVRMVFSVASRCEGNVFSVEKV